MVTELFEYYEAELTYYSQVSKENKITSTIVLIVVFVLFLLCQYFVFFTNQYLFELWGFGILFVGLLFIQFLNLKTIENKFPDIYISQWRWDYRKFNDLILVKLSNKLEETNPNLDLLQNQIEKNINKEKTSFILQTSIFAGLFLPLWSAFVSQIMEIAAENFLNLSIKFTIFTVLIFGLAITGNYFSDVRYTLFTDYKKWSKLNDLITEYRLLKKV
ncbi:hypothetical protein [Zobellia uliginosa]|uniref:hypothetical protein n=1 Tax=Zobellia uliginosa TaxID=143224 RepID=UPI001C06D0A4|nr:hypothetical protein [Zobellia uliginosa]MBU2945805.1 hypothetical protein [Zobellia uliginosa]